MPLRYRNRDIREKLEHETIIPSEAADGVSGGVSRCGKRSNGGADFSSRQLSGTGARGGVAYKVAIWADEVF